MRQTCTLCSWITENNVRREMCMCRQLNLVGILPLVLASVVLGTLGQTVDASIIGASAKLSDGTLVAPTAMFLADGNDVGGNLEQTRQRILAEFGCDLGLSGKTDDSNCGPFIAAPTEPLGILTLDEVIDGPLVLTLKAGNENAAFLFVEQNIVGFEFDTQDAGLTNKRGIGRSLGHASLFTSSVTDPIPPPPIPPPMPDPPSHSAPEPGSFLVLSGLLLASGVFRSGRCFHKARASARG